MFDKLEIVPGYGLGGLKFGLKMDQVKDILGLPEGEEVTDEEGAGKCITWYFWRTGLIAYFEEADDFSLSCLEVDSENMVLWDNSIYNFSINEFISLARKHDLGEVTEEKDEEEVCLSIDSIEMNFYFIENELRSVQFGVLFDENDEVVWPD